MAGRSEFIVFASFSNAPFANGYRISHSALRHGVFIEVLNSDAAAYGGGGVTNTGRLISAHGEFNARLPANGIVVFQRIATGFASVLFKLIDPDSREMGSPILWKDASEISRSCMM